MNKQMKAGDIIRFRQINLDCVLNIPFRGKRKQVGIYCYNKERGYGLVLGGYQGVFSAMDFCDVKAIDDTKVKLIYYHKGIKSGELKGYLVYEKRCKDDRWSDYHILRFKTEDELSLNSACL